MSYPPQEPPPYQPPQPPYQPPQSPYQPPYPTPYPPQQPYPPQLPYPGQPYAGGPYPPMPQRPAKRRPSAWWFAPGVIGLALAIAAGAWAVVLIVSLFDEDAIFQTDGRLHAFEVESSDRMLFVPVGSLAPSCQVTGPDGTSMVSPRPVNNQETLSDGSHDWRPFAEFTPNAATVGVQCSSELVTDVRLGPALNDDAYLPIGFAIVGAIAAGLIGVIALIVVGILFFTRPSRKVTG